MKATMRTMYRSILAVVLVSALLSCRDRASEKKIAELESRLAQIENKSVPAAPGVTASPTAAPAPVETKPDGPLPIAQFETTDHDFGTVQEGQKVSYTYVVKNTGAAPLLIEKASPSCGCTVPDWTKTPIPVGGSGFVKAEFDTHAKTGIQNKTITVTANTWPRTTTIKFAAMVVAKPDGASGPLK